MSILHLLGPPGARRRNRGGTPCRRRRCGRLPRAFGARRPPAQRGTGRPRRDRRSRRGRVRPPDQPGTRSSPPHPPGRGQRRPRGSTASGRRSTAGGSTAISRQPRGSTTPACGSSSRSRLGASWEVGPSGLGDVVGVPFELRHLFSQRAADMARFEFLRGGGTGRRRTRRGVSRDPAGEGGRSHGRGPPPRMETPCRRLRPRPRRPDPGGRTGSPWPGRSRGRPRGREPPPRLGVARAAPARPARRGRRARRRRRSPAPGPNRWSHWPLP